MLDVQQRATVPGGSANGYLLSSPYLLFSAKNHIDQNVPNVLLHKRLSKALDFEFPPTCRSS
jgi:hypothetical protein